jgi:hypothetical protein
MSGASLGVLAGLITQDLGQAQQLVVVVGLPSREVDWRKPIVEYLQPGMIPDDETQTHQTRRLAHRANGYLIHDNELYRCSTLGIIQRYIPPKEGKELLFDIYEGIYGHHTSSWSMFGKAFQQGIYCPTMANDVAQIVRSCRGCQYVAKQIHAPAQELQTIPTAWPFVGWCLDLLGALKRNRGMTHILIAIDKFTKWVKAKPLSKIGSKQAMEFIQDIIFSFGVPNYIITDNST